MSSSSSLPGEIELTQSSNPSRNETCDNNFQIDQTTLTRLTCEKDHEALEKLKGVDGIAKALRSHLVHGIDGDEEDVALRRKAFGANTPENLPTKTFLQFLWEALLDRNILILLICGSVSLGLGIKVDGPKEGLRDGASILVGVFMAVMVVASSHYYHAGVFQKLLLDNCKIAIEVVRGGRRQKIAVVDIVVGDVVCLNYGDKVPANGLLIKPYSLRLEGVKTSCSKEGQDDPVESDMINNDIVLSSGTTVVGGFALMLVTSVAVNARREQNRNTVHELEKIPSLESRIEEIDSITNWIGYVFILVAIIFTLSGILSYNGDQEPATGLTKAYSTVDIVVTFITSVVNIADPMGLTLTLTRTYAMKKLKDDNVNVRKLTALETMTFVDTICINKTGTLTTNQMKVSKFLRGDNFMAEETYSSITPQVKRLLEEGIALNTLSSISPTEMAIQSWALLDLKIGIDNIKTKLDIIHIEAFTPEKKQSWVIAKRKADKTTQLHLKGAAQLILKACSSYYDDFGKVDVLDEVQKRKLEQTINDMATSKLRCIALAHKEVETKEVQDDGNGKLLQDNMILLGILGIEDPCHPMLTEVTKDLHDAGIKLKMITSDNICSAKAMAEECGILVHHSGEVVDAAEFRRLSPEDRKEKVDKICVMANSSPEDKRLMVECLKDNGNVVGVVVHGTNNSSAMKEADIGVYLGKEGTEIIEEHSDIVISNGDFRSIMKLLQWGRYVYSNMQKFIQFQITVSSVALMSNISGVFAVQKATLSTMQLLWVGLITDTLACLAFSTEKPTKELFENKPISIKDPLVTNIMFRNILPQALFQTALLLLMVIQEFTYIYYDDTVFSTLIFNSYVFCQVFNQINARKLERKNVFEKILANKIFFIIAMFIIVLQILLVEILKAIADTTNLTWLEWSLCIGVASLTLPIGLIGRFIPVPHKQVMDYLVVVPNMARNKLKEVASVINMGYEALLSIYRNPNDITKDQGQGVSLN